MLSSYTEIFPTRENLPATLMTGLPLEQTEMLLNGELVKWNGPMQEVFSPVMVQVKHGELERVRVGSFPAAGEAEALRALEAAEAAYDNGRGEWPSMKPRQRIEAMETFVRLMQGKKEQIINLLMWEIGKSLADSTKEFDRTITYIKDTLEEFRAMDRTGSNFQIVEGIIAQIRRSPLGVVLVMGPFNYPLNETFCLLIPAILMGNTVLFKTPKHGSMLHYPLLECFAKAFPKGVVNSVYGPGAHVVPPVLKSGKVDVLALIGSSRVANDLKKTHPKVNRLRAVLGLDAKNAALIMPDAKLEDTIKECVTGSLSYNGQRCTALKILFVHKSLEQSFTEKFVEAVEALKPGMPWTEGVQITPLPEPGKPGYLAELIDDAVAQGAKVANPSGGKQLGSFVAPTVLTGVKEGMKIYREEQFGPVVPVVFYEHLEEFFEYIETSAHGQQASIFGQDYQQLSEATDAIVNLVCRVNINAQCQRGPDVFPFTGRRDSAEGTLSVTDALRAFSIRTVVATKENENNKELMNQIVEHHTSRFISTRFLL